MSLEERRQFPRFNFSVEVRWEKIAGDAEKKPQNKSDSKNLSVGGIRLILNDKVAVGDILELDVRMSETKTIRCKGRVVWLDTFQITGGQDRSGYEGGIQFLDMTEEVQREISRFLFDSSRKKSA